MFNLHFSNNIRKSCLIFLFFCQTKAQPLTFFIPTKFMFGLSACFVACFTWMNDVTCRQKIGFARTGNEWILLWHAHDPVGCYHSAITVIILYFYYQCHCSVATTHWLHLNNNKKQFSLLIRSGHVVLKSDVFLLFVTCKTKTSKFLSSGWVLCHMQKTFVLSWPTMCAGIWYEWFK